MLSFSFPTMPAGEKDSPKKPRSLCVFLLCMHASVNPFCQVLARPFLSKLPAWSQSPLVLVRGAGRKGLWDSCCSQAQSRPLHPRGPGLGFAARRGSVWQLWLTLQSPLPGTPQRNPAFPFTPRKRGEKDNYTHIQQPPSPSLSITLRLGSRMGVLLFPRSVEAFLGFFVFCK